MSSLEAANRIRALKPGEQFRVKTNKDRVTILKAAKLLRNAGIIEFDVFSKLDNGEFKIVAG